MTNRAALVQQGASVYAKGFYATEEDCFFVEDLLESIGVSEGKIKEDLMDVVNALVGSGPGYVFLILEFWLNSSIIFYNLIYVN